MAEVHHGANYGQMNNKMWCGIEGAATFQFGIEVVE
jgi:hypothetical protein